MGTIGTSKSSYLRKNHAGAPFAAGDARRFFVQDGFQVQYYDSDARTKRNGRFDLRNIVTLRPTADPSVTDGVELVISVNGHGVATKTITVSFDDAKEEAPMWKAMWCSAVGETAVDERLKGFRQLALVNADFKQRLLLVSNAKLLRLWQRLEHVNQTFGSQEGLTDSIVALAKGDSAYRAKVQAMSLGRQLDLHGSLSRKA